MNKATSKDNTENLLHHIVSGMQEKKARNILSLDLSEIENTVSHYFVICHATSKQQVAAIADSVIEEVHKNCETKPFHQEGMENSEWILIDYFDIVVHIFLEDIRTFYHIEDLWADSEIEKYQSDN